MPKLYLEIKRAYLKADKSKKEAKRLATMTYNAQRKRGQNPVTGKHKKRKKK